MATYLFPSAIITKYHKVDGLDNRNLFFRHFQDQKSKIKVSFFFFFFFFFSFLFMVTAAYGSSWAKGEIGAASASLGHSLSNPDLSHICHLYDSLWQCWILTERGQGSNLHLHGC